MRSCINAFFETASRISGVGFDVIQTESEQQHKKAFSQTRSITVVIMLGEVVVKTYVGARNYYKLAAGC